MSPYFAHASTKVFRLGSRTFEAELTLLPFPPHPSVDLLILITSRSTPKTLFDQDIYLATNFLLLPLPTSVKDASSLADPRDRHLLKLVKTGLAACEGRLWFSYERDLTNSMDRAYKKRESTESLWEKVGRLEREGAGG